MDDDTSDHASSPSATTAVRLTTVLAHETARPLAAGLYLIATPIGHLADITIRALAVLARADVIYCEDTRHSRTLLSHYAIRTPLRPYHEHNAEEQRPRILAELAQGHAVALISDAGTPLVSDPGFKLVRDAAAAGHAVVAIPGPSATLAALTVSGLPTDAFFFAGFLPAKTGARQSRIAELAAIPSTLILFEAPTRTATCLRDLAEGLGDRSAAVARELTKLHEEVRRAPLSELADHFESAPPKGEIVILIAPPGEEDVSDAAIETRLADALATLTTRDAARTVADALKVPKGRVYDLALALKERMRSERP